MLILQIFIINKQIEIQQWMGRVLVFGKVKYAATQLQAQLTIVIKAKNPFVPNLKSTVPSAFLCYGIG